MNIKAHHTGMHLQVMCRTINQRILHYYAPKHPESFILRNYQYAGQSPKQLHTDIISAQLVNYAVTVMWLAP
jgi:hypothetical protein